MFNVDTVRSRVGIGVARPSYTLHIVGTEVKLYGDRISGHRISDASSGGFQFNGSRARIGGSVMNNDRIAIFSFRGHDGTDSNTTCAAITVNVDGTPASNSIPTEISFEVMPDGSTSRIQAMIIRNSGNIGFSTVTPLAKLHVAGTSNQIQQIIQAHSTQTENIQEIQLSDGTVTGGFDDEGALFSDEAEIENLTVSQDADVVGNFTAGTIQADDGWTGTFTNGDGDTVTVTGGIITNVS
ncbi:MAG: hypothetical protein ACTSYA_02395 [Candidatus Kariarchaeaceae archaeon]